MCALALLRTSPGLSQDAESPQPIEFESTSKHLISLVADPTASARAPDGRTLATGDDHGNIILWDVETARPVRRLTGHTDTVSALAFAPTSTRLASAAYDGQVRIWDVGTGEALRVLAGHERRVTCIAWSPDGSRLLSGGYDKTLRIWNMADETAGPLILRDHTATVQTVAFSPDGARFASTDTAGGVRIANTQTGEEIGRIETGVVVSLTFLPEGRLCTDDRDGNVRLWHDPTRDGHFIPVSSFTPLQHDDPVTQIVLAPDGATLALANRYGGLHITDVATWEETSALDAHADEVLGLSFLPDSRSLLTIGRDRAVRLWRAKHPANPRLAALEVPKVRLWSLEVDRLGTRIVAGGRKGFLALWDQASGEQLRQYEGFNGTVDVVAFTTDGAHLAACSWKEKTISIWDVETPAQRLSLDAGANVRCVRFSPDGRWLAAGCEDGVIRIWDWQSAGSDPRTVPSGPGSVYDIAFSPNGKVLAGCGGDWTKNDPGFVTVWETDQWSELRRMGEHTRAVRTVVFTPDGSQLASAGEDGLIVLWHGETFVPVARLSNPDGLRPLAFSPEGSRLACGLHDGTIHLWDTVRGEVVQRCQAEDDVFGLGFSKDGTALFSVSGETRVEIWPTGEAGGDNDAERIRHWNRTGE